MSIQPSASGTVLDNASNSLVDAAGAVWTLTGIVAGFLPVVDGLIDARFRGNPVQSLVYCNNRIYGYLANGIWCRFEGGEFYTEGKDPRGSPSPAGTTLSNANGEIIDSTLTHWTLAPITAGYEPALNGVVDTRIAANPVQSLLFYGDTVYAYASDQVWYAYGNGDYTAVTGDPRPGGASSSGRTLNDANGSLVDASRVLWTLAVVSGGYEPVRNGVVDISFVDNPVQLLLFYMGTMYALTANTRWYAWNGTTYIQQLGDPRFSA